MYNISLFTKDIHLHYFFPTFPYIEMVLKIQICTIQENNILNFHPTGFRAFLSVK